MKPPHSIGVIGARSLVAHHLVPKLEGMGTVNLFSRGGMKDGRPRNVRSGAILGESPLTRLFYLAPIWTFREHAESIRRAGVKRIIALSSMSASSKLLSADPGERMTATALVEGEKALLNWSASSDTSVMIIRPTMIYDGVRDRNVATLVRFIRRFGFLPVAGAATGLRQPLHADDLAEALIRAMNSSLTMRCDPLGGSETFPYDELVMRIFDQLGRRRRIVRLPLPMLRVLIRVARAFGRPWTEQMADRMNRDLTADDRELRQLLGLAQDHFRIR
jgi:nucleoside-diphosphate-sugar epimerase